MSFLHTSGIKPYVNQSISNPLYVTYTSESQRVSRECKLKSVEKQNKTKNQHVMVFFFPQQFLNFLKKAISVSAAQGMLGKWVIRSCAGFSGCRLITQRDKNRWPHHRLSPSLSVGWRNVRACAAWPLLPSARVLFESGSAITLDLSERSAGTKLYPLANIDFELQAWI